MIISEIAHSALVIMGELAKEYRCRKISASQISQSNNIPQHIIDTAATQLIDFGFIDIDGDMSCQKVYASDTPLFLTKHPDEIYIADILKSLERNEFKGIFVDIDGAPLPQSRLTMRLNILRRRSETAVTSSMLGISVNVLATWSKLEIGAIL